MKAFVTSIGEPTTDLCVWSLQRQGFDVELVQSSSSLWEKLRYIYEVAEGDFLRVDADVVVNKNVKLLSELDTRYVWWYQARTYGWFSQDATHGGVQLYGARTLPILRAKIEEARHLERPETYMSRLDEFHNPRRFETFERLCGLHGYKQDDYDRIMRIKDRRKQMGNYDFELAKKLDDI